MTSYLMKCPQTWHPGCQNCRARILQMKNSKQNKIHQENSRPRRLKVKGMLKVLKEHSILEVVRFGFMKTILFVNLSERKGFFFWRALTCIAIFLYSSPVHLWGDFLPITESRPRPVCQLLDLPSQVQMHAFSTYFVHVLRPKQYFVWKKRKKSKLIEKVTRMKYNNTKNYWK